MDCDRLPPTTTKPSIAANRLLGRFALTPEQVLNSLSVCQRFQNLKFYAIAQQSQLKLGNLATGYKTVQKALNR
ncbi:hypothetical protein NIES4072_69950 [Nostoc commune NIES-4072]|uniref:Uncharacterized protein n=1 Tax=Nostoc commune NIES-4072 TaxID=2005467 RepID=A0A2R5G4A7_NOSCO|nr:hypothetical protein [Nostoc commune]BBD70628.1 hypothetical protein NIES4070_70390 [Nostoc commune HK-02]GBG23283.1 hypothetical protein NIES4072_69950 [Nostoc commune NIES-4072]